MSAHFQAGRFDSLHGDEDQREYTPREQGLIEDGAASLVEYNLGSWRWWNERMEGQNAASAAVPDALSRCMSNLDNACKGDRIATDAILAALSNLQRQARADAQAEAREAAERAMEQGELG